MLSKSALQQYSKRIKQLATQVGFSYCGIAEATLLEDDARKLERWLNGNMHGSMEYMANHFDKRVDPRKLVDDAKSVISLLYNYYPPQVHSTDGPKISKYAYGRDYHLVIKEKLHELFSEMRAHIGDIGGRVFVDSAPILERTWAVRSGIGWIGKNGNLITKSAGSFFFIATIVTDLPLEYDGQYMQDYCGTCTACIDSCPTEAILPNKVINGERCISHYTIELKSALIPPEQKGKFDNWLFGCDTCQDVCPWNRFSKQHDEPTFSLLPEIFDLRTQDWCKMSEQHFNQVFKDSPLKRSKWSGIQRNLKFLQID
jgi:epoxyqueuosine reductase